MTRFVTIALASALLCGCAHAPSDGEALAARWTPDVLSSDLYESSPTFSADGNEVHFMRADRAFSSYRLLSSRCTKDGWSAPQPLPFAAVPPAMDADPFLTRDGKRLYFVSTRQDPVAGQFDIWSVARLPDGDWGVPMRLPEPVNSAGSELLPRLDRDGNLYFGSDRDGGLGGGDIYVASQDADERWSVSNVGPPVSTGAYEYEAAVSDDGQTLLVVADRGDRSHLYRFVRKDGRWEARGRAPGRQDVFQVGPLLSPSGDRLLFAQDDGARSGEWFVADLVAGADRRWPPSCPPTQRGR